MASAADSARGRDPAGGAGSPRYGETQARKPRWVWALVLLADFGACATVAWLFLREPTGGEPSRGGNMGVWLVLAGVLVATSAALAFVAVARLEIEVYDDRIRVRWIPFVDRSIPLAHVVGVEAETYRPMREYGGWGIRGSKRRRAYSMSGDTGVLVSLFDGSTVMLGTEDPQRLAAAIEAALSRTPL
ncbi:MAG: hypothetical protein IT198_14885 [Acidimicrobiia bacterium]|nr:hypothetical protein [Acidimicrobiia bacterium]